MASSPRYPTGQLVAVTDTVTVAGVLTNPTTEFIRVEDPAGNVTTDQIPGGTGLLTNPLTGVFTANVDTTPGTGGNAGKAGPGVWRVRFWATGTAQHANADYEFIVDDSPLK